MAKGGFYDFLKQVIGDMVDSNGNMRVTPIGNTGKRNLSNNRIKVLVDLINLLKDTTIITEESKLYVFDKYITIKGVNEALNISIANSKDELKFNNTLSKIQYDKNKLERIFGSRFFIDILSFDTDIAQYERIIAEQYFKYTKNKNKLRDNIALNIDKNYMASEIKDEDFKEFISIIKPYIKSHMMFIEQSLNKDMIGYFNYILSMPSLQGVDKDRYNLLATLLEDTNTDSKK